VADLPKFVDAYKISLRENPNYAFSTNREMMEHHNSQQLAQCKEYIYPVEWARRICTLEPCGGGSSASKYRLCQMLAYDIVKHCPEEEYLLLNFTASLKRTIFNPPKTVTNLVNRKLVEKNLRSNQLLKENERLTCHKLGEIMTKNMPAALWNAISDGKHPFLVVHFEEGPRERKNTFDEDFSCNTTGSPHTVVSMLARASDVIKTKHANQIGGRIKDYNMYRQSFIDKVKTTLNQFGLELCGIRGTPGRRNDIGANVISTKRSDYYSILSSFVYNFKIAEKLGPSKRAEHHVRPMKQLYRRYGLSPVFNLGCVTCISMCHTQQQYLLPNNTGEEDFDDDSPFMHSEHDFVPLTDYMSLFRSHDTSSSDEDNDDDDDEDNVEQDGSSNNQNDRERDSSDHRERSYDLDDMLNDRYSSTSSASGHSFDSSFTRRLEDADAAMRS